MRGNGRDRRRRGLLNVLRRWLCGLFLTSWSLHGHAAAEPAKQPARTRHPSSHIADWEFSGDRAPMRVSLQGPVPPSRHHLAARPWPWLEESTLISARFNMDAASLVSGIDVDLNVAGFASLHLMLNSEGPVTETGRRWAVTTDESLLHRAGKSCSLTAALDFVQMAPYGENRMVFVPQLHFALDTMFGAPRSMAASLRYSHWSGSQEKEVVGSQVPQLLLSWSF
jgi:hypothetical protein